MAGKYIIIDEAGEVTDAMYNTLMDNLHLMTHLPLIYHPYD